jgi:hypothetical protein
MDNVRSFLKDYSFFELLVVGGGATFFVAAVIYVVLVW